jgi:hypothetical protein
MNKYMAKAGGTMEVPLLVTAPSSKKKRKKCVSCKILEEDEGKDRMFKF